MKAAIFALLFLGMAIDASFQNMPNLWSSRNSSNSTFSNVTFHYNSSNSTIFHHTSMISNSTNHSSMLDCSNEKNLSNLMNLVDNIRRLILRNATKMDAFVEEIAKASNLDFQKYVKILGSEYTNSDTTHGDLQDIESAEEMIQNLEPFFCKYIYSELDSKDTCLVRMIHNLTLLKGDLKFRDEFVEYLKKNEKNYGEYLIMNSNGVEVNYEKILMSKQIELARFMDIYKAKMKSDRDYACNNEIKVPDLKELERKVQEIVSKNSTILRELIQFLNAVSSKDLDLKRFIIKESNQTERINVEELMNVKGAIQALNPFFSKYIWAKLSNEEICLIDTIADIDSLLTDYENSFRIINSIDKFIRNNLDDYRRYLIENPQNDIKFDIQKLILDKPEFLFKFIKNQYMM